MGAWEDQDRMFGGSSCDTYDRSYTERQLEEKIKALEKQVLNMRNHFNCKWETYLYLLETPCDSCEKMSNWEMKSEQ